MSTPAQSAVVAPKSNQIKAADKQTRSNPRAQSQGPSAPESARKSKGKRSKKAKTAHKPETQPMEKCWLDTLPFELIAEVLSYTSPRDILALARTNKFFCTTLVKESSVFIWKKSRERCRPAPLPDPTPNFTEPAYAAFLFDGGVCEVSYFCYVRFSRVYDSERLVGMRAEDH